MVYLQAALPVWIPNAPKNVRPALENIGALSGDISAATDPIPAMSLCRI